MRSSSRIPERSIHTYHLIIRHPEYEPHDKIDPLRGLSGDHVGGEQTSFTFDRAHELRAADVGDGLEGRVQIAQHLGVDEPREGLGIVSSDRGDDVVRCARLFDLGKGRIGVVGGALSTIECTTTPARIPIAKSESVTAARASFTANHLAAGHRQCQREELIDALRVTEIDGVDVHRVAADGRAADIREGERLDRAGRAAGVRAL